MFRTKVHTLRRDQGRLNGPLLSFLLGMLGALAIFLPFLIVDKGFFLYAGDYNCQQIPFYMYVQQFIKSMGGTWSWATDLGSSVVNSYSFYNIGSPFLWLTLPFPNSWMPYLMVPLFMLKFGCIAAAANLYLSRYTKSRNLAVIVSLVYAFCGFNVYNIFFNHMLDPVVLFPLMLWAMDGFVYEKKRGWFAVAVGLALLNSYFFFVGNVVFLLIYFCVKVAYGEFKVTPKEFGLLALEAVIGVGIGMALALPSFYNLMGNPRTSDFASGFGIMMYGNVQQYFAIFNSALVPPDPPYLPNVFTEGAIKWTSMSFFLPLVSVAGVVAYWRARRKSAMKTVLGICLLAAMVPFLNSAFYAFNASYYARWYYMPILIMCFMTMKSLEDEDIDIVFGAKAALAVTGAYIIWGILPDIKDGVRVYGLAQHSEKFWLTFLTAMVGAALFYLVVRYYRNKVRFAPLLLSAVMGFSVFYSVVHLSLGKFPQWGADANYREEMYVGSQMLELPEDQFYRIDAYQCYDNMGLWLDKSCIQTFNSVVTPSIMEFYPLVGVKRDVSSKPERKYYALRGLLSVQYTVMPLDAQDDFEAAMGEEEYQGNKGWRYYTEAGPLLVYENENFVPMGFTYNSYIDMEDLESAPERDRSLLLMRSLGLTEEQAAQYGHLFVDGREGSRQETTGENGEQLGSRFLYDEVNYEAYVEDCDARRETASYDLQADATGFVSRINLERENLVFYATPYDPGFTATVNGQPAEVLKVSGGMMAVYAPAGDNEIVFIYKTPGFSFGLSLSLLSLAALGLYLVLCMRGRQKAAAKMAKAAEAEGVAIGLIEDLRQPGDGIPNWRAKERSRKLARQREREAEQQRLEEERREAEELAAPGAGEIPVDLEGNPLPEAEAPEATMEAEVATQSIPEEPAGGPDDKPGKK